MDSELVSAFKFHMREASARATVARAVNPTPAIRAFRGNAAREALARARLDVAEGKDRYPNPYPLIGHGKGWKPESDGLRYVGRVVPDERRDSIWDSRGNTGWYTDPHGEVFRDGSGLCYGVVYQLPGRKGESRFVAGHEFGDVDGGPTLDLSRVFVEPRSDWYGRASTDCDAAIDAASHADSLAKSAAEEEREYQTAWAAGSQWADEGETIAAARRKALALLKERRAAMRGEMPDRALKDAPSVCRLIEEKVSDLVESIREARERRATLANGNAEDFYFWNGEQRLRDAFMEGAGIDKFPA